MRYIRTALCSTGVLLLARCSANEPNTERANVGTSPAPSVSDSAGVRILEYRSLRGDVPVVRIDRPFLELGGTRHGEDEELDARQPWLSATVLSDGTIVVNETVRLKFFDKTGRFLRSVGRRGSGPGEFNQTREVCRLSGDSLLVIDYSDGRLSVWDAVGQHVRTFNRPGFVPFQGCLPNGTVLVRGLMPNVDPQASDAPFEYSLAFLDGRFIQSLGKLGTPKYAGPIFFEPSVVAYGSQVFVGDPERYEIRVLNLSGHLTRLIRVKDAPRLVTDEEWRRMIDATVPPNQPPSVNRAAVIARLTARKPKAFPAFQRVRVDPKGRIWIGDYENRRVWTILDSTGVFIGRLEVPSRSSWQNTELVGIEADDEAEYIVVLGRDPNGAPILSFHRFGLP